MKNAGSGTLYGAKEEMCSSFWMEYWNEKQNSDVRVEEVERQSEWYK